MLDVVELDYLQKNITKVIEEELFNMTDLEKFKEYDIDFFCKYDFSYNTFAIIQK